MRYRLRTLLNLLALLTVLAAIPCFITGYHDHYTCVLCRAFRTDYIYLDHNWRTNVNETACSRWYRLNIEPTHRHVWVRGRDAVYRDLYGRRFAAISRDRAGKAIWFLRPDDQMAIYERLPVGERKRIFLSISDANPATGRDYEIVHSLQDWKVSGFREPAPVFPAE
jgi:hypothetical protein